MVCNPQKFKGWPLAESVWLQPSRIQFFHHQDDMNGILLHFPRWHPSGADPVDIRWCVATYVWIIPSDAGRLQWIILVLVIGGVGIIYPPTRQIYNYLVYKRYILQIGWLYTTTLYKNLKNPLKTLAINRIQVIQFVTFWFLRRSRWTSLWKNVTVSLTGPQKSHDFLAELPGCHALLITKHWGFEGFRVFPTHEYLEDHPRTDASG